MSSLNKSQLPCGFKHAKLFEPVTRCGLIDVKSRDHTTFKLHRDVHSEDYHFIVPLSNKNIPDYVRKIPDISFPNRLSQLEVERTILGKIQTENVLLQNLFNDASKNKNGYITRSDLYTILLHLCPLMKHSQFETVLRRCDLDKFNVFFFETIETKLHKLTQIDDLSPYCDVDSGFRRIKGTNALHRLKLAAMSPTFDLKDLLPPSVFEPDGIVLMPQLRDALCRIDIRMTDTEFVRFWEKFDKVNVGSIPTKFLLYMLNLQDNGLPMCGIHAMPSLKLLPKPAKSSKRPPCDATHKCLVRIEEIPVNKIGAGGVSFPLTRIHGWKPQGCGGTNEPELGKGTRYLRGLKSLSNSHPKYESIIDNLCYIFQTPYHAMLVIFHHYDQRNRGKVPINESMEIFLEYGFSITWSDFLEFLKRTGCIFDHSFLKYRQLLDKYQSKEELSYVDRAIKLIIQTQYEDIGLKTLTTMTPNEIEKHLINMLHGPYIRLMEELQKKCDTLYTVDTNTMKSAIERLVLGYSIRDDQWNDLIPYLNIDESSGRIPYKKFLYLFSKPSQSCKKLCPQPPMKVSSECPWDARKYERDSRDLLDLCLMVEKLLKRRFHVIDKYYKYFEKNEMHDFKENQFFELLHSERMDITPSELRLVWNVMILQRPGPYTYQMVMKFMMTQLTKVARAIKIKEKFDRNKGFYDRNIDVLRVFKKHKEIENQIKEETILAKINATDKDISSKPTNANIDDILGKIRPIVHEQWEKIKSYLIKLDVIGSTTIENYQMKDYFMKTFPELTKKEVLTLIDKYDVNSNGRFDYVNFLMQFRVTKDDKSISTKFDSHTYEMIDKKTKSTYYMSEVREVLRKSMISKWKNLLSAFRKLDECKMGYLQISQINTVLEVHKVFLKEDDLYHILTNFDKNMDGKIDYYEFIKEILDINLVAVN